MQRISTSSRDTDKFGPGKDGFRNGVPAAGIAATQLDANWFNAVQEELATVIEGAGLALDPSRYDQLADAIRQMVTAAQLPAGSVIMWSGSLATIPPGWALCDGQAGRPDLRDLMVVGAGGRYAAGDRGGAAEVNTGEAGDHSHGGKTGATALTIEQMPRHAHSISIIRGNSEGGVWVEDAGGGGAPQVNATDYAGGDQPHDHAIVADGRHRHTVSVMPPYLALAFIIKL